MEDPIHVHASYRANLCANVNALVECERERERERERASTDFHRRKINVDPSSRWKYKIPLWKRTILSMREEKEEKEKRVILGQWERLDDWRIIKSRKTTEKCLEKCFETRTSYSFSDAVRMGEETIIVRFKKHCPCGIWAAYKCK